MTTGGATINGLRDTGRTPEQAAVNRDDRHAGRLDTWGFTRRVDPVKKGSADAMTLADHGMNSAMTPARHRLELSDVRHAYAGGPEVIQGVSLAVEPGETACLLGPSGCGKTTLLRLAAGLETLQAGRITIGARVVAEGGGIQVPPEARGVGLMFQDYALFPHLTIFENITFGLAGGERAERRAFIGRRASRLWRANDSPRGSAGRARRAERLAWVERGLQRIGLAEMADCYPHTLSGGQRQRVALLRALAPEPRVMLLDEPFSGLDVTLRAQVREDTLGLLKETGVATLMVTHDPEEAMLMADRLLVMNDGRIMQAGRPHDVSATPASAFVAALFGPVNRLSGRVQGGRVETALGVFAAPGLADGAACQILIRIEGVRAAPPGAEPPGVGGTVTLNVIDARSLGRASILHLADGDGGLSVQARIPGVFLPAPGQPVAVWTNPAQTFVFPA